MVVQLSVIYQQKKLHGHIEILNILRNSSKCFTKFQIFYEIPKFISEFTNFFRKTKNILQNSKKFRKNSKKICKKPKNFVKNLQKTKHMYSLWEKPKIFCKKPKNFVKIQKNL